MVESMKMKDSSQLVNYLMIGLLVVGAYFIGVYKTKADLLSGGAQPAQVAEVGGDQPTAPEAKAELTDEEWQSILVDPAFAMGDENAPVTLVEYTDYQCPFCKRYYDQTYSQLISDYVDSGKVRYLVRDLPLSFHPNAEPAAVAARCAGQQGRYQEMHDLLFENQEEWAELSDATSTFVDYANQIGVNITACMSDESVVASVREDASLASNIGATGTPTFVVNGKILVGAQPTSSFVTLIEGEL